MILYDWNALFSGCDDSVRLECPVFTLGTWMEPFCQIFNFVKYCQIYAILSNIQKD